MPPFRRRFKRRKFSRRRFGRKFGRGLAPRRSGGFFGVRRNTLAAEKKFLDSYLNVASINTITPTFLLVNGVGAGTGFNERVGRKIKIKSIQLNGVVIVGTAVPARVRLMLVLDRQANGSTPSIGNILDNTTILVNSKAFMNLDNRARFSVIWDKKVTLDAVMKTQVDYSVFKKKLIDVTYSGTTNGIGSISTNSIWFVAVSDQGVTNAPTFVGGVRIRYTDA